MRMFLMQFWEDGTRSTSKEWRQWPRSKLLVNAADEEDARKRASEYVKALIQLEISPRDWSVDEIIGGIFVA
jgi:hypothetical protein